LNITIAAVGSIKEKHIMSGIRKFKKDLGRYCHLDIVEVRGRMAPDGLSLLQLEQVKHREGVDILKRIKREDHVIALDIGGKRMTSREMAGYITSLAQRGIQSIAFIIGGSNGLSKQVLDRADLKLSFSAMTFPHQLMRLILLEQLCRCLKKEHR
jgi:23S rRNA (pseudouridine1915-N3)-methyltransferase